MRNPLLEKWESRLYKVFDRVDARLEKKYEGAFPLKPNRPEAGKGIGAAQDGLFDLSVLFTPGFGSKLGPGYVFKVRLATLEKVPEDFIVTVEDEAVDLIRQELKQEYPDKEFEVARDGNTYKITGDLDL